MYDPCPFLWRDEFGHMSWGCFRRISAGFLVFSSFDFLRLFSVGYMLGLRRIILFCC